MMLIIFRLPCTNANIFQSVNYRRQIWELLWLPSWIWMFKLGYLASKIASFSLFLFWLIFFNDRHWMEASAIQVLTASNVEHVEKP